MTDGLALPQGYRLHEYEIVRELGEGGFGITYLGYDHHLDKPVAIKEYLPAELAARSEGYSVVPRSAQRQPDFMWGLSRCLEEARTLARFEHRNIIRVHRYFEMHGTAYIVMEYAEGETLWERLQREQRLREDALLEILLPILDGLDKVHSAGMLHRDITPKNIIIRGDGSPVLIDFGAARQAVGARSRSITSLLTLGYAPIEQYSTNGDQGPWTDIYALGAVCYEAVTSKKPDEAADRVRSDRLVPAVQAGRDCAGAAFLEAVDWALRVNEHDRPQSIAQWRAALDSRVAPASTEPGTEEEWTPKPSARTPTSFRKRWAWTIAAVAPVIIALASLAIWSAHRSETYATELALERASSARDRYERFKEQVDALVRAEEMPNVETAEAMRIRRVAYAVMTGPGRDYTYAAAQFDLARELLSQSLKEALDAAIDENKSIAAQALDRRDLAEARRAVETARRLVSRREALEL